MIFRRCLVRVLDFLLFKFNNHYDRIYTEIYLLLINQIDQIDCVPKQMRNHLRGL